MSQFRRDPQFMQVISGDGRRAAGSEFQSAA
jgi:hypothetical protein